MLRWICIQTHSGKELIALEHLNRQYSDMAYCPMTETDKRLNLKAKTEPLFKTYIFLRLDDEIDDFSPIRSTRGVLSGYVKTGNKPSIVPDYVIEDLKNCSRDKVIDYRHGNQVRILVGNFSDYLARIEKVDKKRIFAVVEGIDIILERDQIEPI